MPHEQPPPSERQPHRHRQVAESFGTDPERYDRTRPRYPDALVERVVAASPRPDVLDVGCGTGTKARQFQAVGCTVLGIEPDARMAELARRRGVEVEVATFEARPPRRCAPEQGRYDWERSSPATSGWTSCRRPAPSPSSRRTSWPRCWPASAPRSTRWEAASPCPTPPWRSPPTGCSDPEQPVEDLAGAEV
jgi:hypothetical protein